MTDRSASRATALSIAAVERDTGLSKDTLRVWERRYGFPQPVRDASGERSYSPEQVDKLRAIKRLLDTGRRPGRLVAMRVAELRRLAEDGQPVTRRSGAKVGPAVATPDVQACIDLLRERDSEALRHHLTRALARLGLARFVEELIAPLSTRVGDEWMRGRLAVFEEHLYTQVVHGLLRHALCLLPPAPLRQQPRVLFTTFPGEQHSTGLLMAEALFALEACPCMSLGTETPVLDIIMATSAHRADIVALSFTANLNANRVRSGLVELRSKLAHGVEIWVGGSAPALRRRAIDGVRTMTRLSEITEALALWRSVPR